MSNPAQGPKQPQKQRPVQPWEEPAEIVKTAFEQVGARPPQETPLHQSSAGQTQPQPSPEEKNRPSRMQAFREELQQIHGLQKKREEDVQQRWHQQEVVRQQREEEAKKARGNILTEPVTRAKRGLLGGMGRMFGVGKKQRQVEIAKTPTN